VEPLLTLCWGDNSQGQCDVVPGSYQSIAGGSYHTLAVTIVTGACCTGNEVRCVVTRESDCKAELGLTWSGPNTTCNDAVCTASCEGDTTGNGVVDFTDLISVLNNWGPCS
jgi:hypothetical protein